MKRSIVLTVSFLLCLLALVMSFPRASRVVKAADPCEDCMRSAQERFDACVAATNNNIFCYDQFNRDVVVCYRFFCEQ